MDFIIEHGGAGADIGAFIGGMQATREAERRSKEDVRRRERDEELYQVELELAKKRAMMDEVDQSLRLRAGDRADRALELNARQADELARYRDAQLDLQERAGDRADRGLEADLARMDQEAGFREQEMAGREADRALRARALEQDMELSERRFGLDERREDRLDRSEAASLEMQGRRLDLVEREAAQRAAALDRDLDEREALRAFNTIQAMKVPAEQLGQGLKLIGESLGGGLGSALQVVAGMRPDETAVFQRLAPEFQLRYLNDMAEQRKEERDTVRLARGMGVLNRLEAIGGVDPERAQALREDLGAAETPEQRAAVLDQVEASRIQYGRERINEHERQTLAAEFEGRRAKLAEAGASKETLRMLHGIQTELETDPAIEPEAYEDRFNRVLQGVPAETVDGLELPQLDPVAVSDELRAFSEAGEAALTGVGGEEEAGGELEEADAGPSIPVGDMNDQGSLAYWQSTNAPAEEAGRRVNGARKLVRAAYADGQTAEEVLRTMVEEHGWTLDEPLLDLVMAAEGAGDEPEDRKPKGRKVHEHRFR